MELFPTALRFWRPRRREPIARLMKGWRTRPWASLTEAVCRFGYLARGVVYVTVGWIALLDAFHLTPASRGASEALDSWSRWPPGYVLLFLVGTGLYAFAAWRALQSLFDADRQGTSLRALAARTGQAISGAVYAALAVSVFGLLDILDDFTESDDREATQAAVDQLLRMPGGESAVIALGLFILACGAGGLIQAVFRDYCEPLACPDRIARPLSVLGRAGYAARGAVFLVAGGFTTAAGLHASSGEAKGVGAALEWLEALPSGDLLLGLAAAGFIAFGLFAFVEARFRRMRLEPVIKG